METITAIVGGAAGAAFVTGVVSLIKWWLDRHAQKKDKKENKNDKVAEIEKTCEVRGKEMGTINGRLDAVESSLENITNLIKTLTSQVEDVYKKNEEHAAIEARTRILNFGAEISRQIKHTEEQYKQILIDIDFYSKYCQKNPDFTNTITTVTTERIVNVYRILCEQNDFLD